jgi:hypothetical protein
MSPCGRSEVTPLLCHHVGDLRWPHYYVTMWEIWGDPITMPPCGRSEEIPLLCHHVGDLRWPHYYVTMWEIWGDPITMSPCGRSEEIPLLCHHVEDLRRLHYGSSASDLVPWIYNDRLNIVGTFFSQSNRLLYAKQYSNSNTFILAIFIGWYIGSLSCDL